MIEWRNQRRARLGLDARGGLLARPDGRRLAFVSAVDGPEPPMDADKRG